MILRLYVLLYDLESVIDKQDEFIKHLCDECGYTTAWFIMGTDATVSTPSKKKD
jgi:hypothetical protein